jgi:hypothetical protein
MNFKEVYMLTTLFFDTNKKNMNSIERKLQLCLNKIQNWADINGFKFSRTKTAYVHFCNKRKHDDDPKLELDSSPIKVLKEMKFLGVIF